MAGKNILSDEKVQPKSGNGNCPLKSRNCKNAIKVIFLVGKSANIHVFNCEFRNFQII